MICWYCSCASFSGVGQRQKASGPRAGALKDMANLITVQLKNELEKIYHRKSEDLKLFQLLDHSAPRSVATHSGGCKCFGVTFAICCFKMKLWEKCYQPSAIGSLQRYSLNRGGVETRATSASLVLKGKKYGFPMSSVIGRSLFAPRSVFHVCHVWVQRWVEASWRVSQKTWVQLFNFFCV